MAGRLVIDNLQHTPTLVSKPHRPATQNRRSLCLFMYFVVESRPSQVPALHQQARRVTAAALACPLASLPSPSPNPSPVFHAQPPLSRRTARLLHSTARDSASFPCVLASDRPRLRNVSCPAPGLRWGCSKGRIVASNTSKTLDISRLHREMVVFLYSNTLAGYSSWQNGGARHGQTWTASLTHTCSSPAGVGKARGRPQTVNMRKKHFHPQAFLSFPEFVSRFDTCHPLRLTEKKSTLCPLLPTLH